MRDFVVKLNRRLAQGVYNRALADVRAGNLERASTPVLFANIVSVFVLSVPLIIMMLGLWLMWVGYPNVGSLVFGALFLAAGLYLMPRRVRCPDNVSRRADMPQTFALLDDICLQLDAPKYTALLIDESFNASVTTIGKERLITIGAPLWEVATNAEKLAVLGHETGHMVNNDPGRRWLISKALDSLRQWDAAFGDGGGNVAAELVLAPLNLITEMLTRLIVKMIFIESQRAEYLADFMGARVSGPHNMMSLLELITLLPLADERLNTMFGAGSLRGRDMLAELARAVTQAPHEVREKRLLEMREQKHSVDRTHPPSVYRIAFLQQIDVPPPQSMTLSALDAEWAPHLKRVGDMFYEKVNVQ